jgi:NAD(P)-dependent dehydrogenase (short-subunit alcohol dehydrogenase family)
VPNDLTGRVALVTGAGAGIGQEIARCLAAAGANVAVNDIDPERAARTVALVHASGGEASAHAGDVIAPGGADALIAAIVAEHGALQIAVNNVGMMGGRRAAPFLEMSAADARTILERNLIATYVCCLAEGDAMRSGGGVILNVTSGEASRPSPMLAAYGAAKAAIDHLTRTLAVELGPLGIRVNALAPGTTYTEEVAAVITPEAFEARGRGNPLGHAARPEELGHLAVFLASDGASAITGQIIHADCGAGLGSAPTGARPTEPNG